MSVLNKAYLTSKITEQSGQVVEVSNVSNTHKANNVNTDITIDKTAEKKWVLPGGKVLVTTTITNNTDMDISNIRLTETISDNAHFISGTLKVGSQSYPEADPTTGFDLSVTLGASGTDVSVSYEIESEKYPESDSISVQTVLALTLEEQSFNVQSSVMNITILNNEVYLLKTANTRVVKSGDELTYTIEISNEGTFTNTELFFKDPIPEGTEFVMGSVKVNNEEMADFNPETGFNLGDLSANAKITVQFKVKVK